MTQLTRSVAIMAGLLAASLAAAPAQAQLMRTFVSAAGGNDANDCNLATPCRSFQGAHDKTLPDGEITVLDPGGYGIVTITKAISIVNDGVGEAGMLVSGGANGITINAPSGARVNLRGITVQGIGFGGGNGLRFNSGFALAITKCVFRNHTGSGITFFPSSDGTFNLFIADTLTADNGGFGVNITSSSSAATGSIHGVLERVRMLNNSSDGLLIDGALAAIGGTETLDVTVKDSLAANNGRDGFSSFSVTEGITRLAVIRSAAVNNRGFGVIAEDGSKASLHVGQSVIAGNGKTWLAAGGAVLRSFGDNYIAGNADGDPAPPTIARK